MKLAGINRRERTPAERSGRRIVSKSAYLNGLQCPKLLWYRCNDPDQIPAPDEQTRAIFDQGHEVGQLARQLFADGVEVGRGIIDLDQVIALSRQAIRLRRPLFEAAFSFEGAYARADVLDPVGTDAWDLIEVKSTATLKDIHLHDLAFQAYVFAGAGLNIRRCLLAHINSNYVRQGQIDPRSFFVLEDVTSQISELSRDVPEKLEEMFRIIRKPEYPQIAIGPQCDDPYKCPLHDYCWKFLPKNNVLTLYRGRTKGFKLLAEGITELENIPDRISLTANQKIQRTASLTGQPHVDKAAIGPFVGQFRYPVAYLDFETLGTAIPLFDGVRPYQQIPFQYSCHVLRSANGELEHDYFLAEGPDDPRRQFMERLRQALPGDGSIVVYNASFELGRLEECCEVYPEFTAWVNGLKRRVVDLLLPFRGFRYYHPQQGGSASMKAVLPALTGKGYNHLDIEEGGMASLKFLRVTFGDVSPEERARVRKNLEEYCGLDTLGMVWIVEALRALAGG